MLEPRRLACLLVPLITCLPSFALAQTDSDMEEARRDDIERSIAACAAQQGELNRLECYDTMARERGLDGPQPVAIAATDTGKWVVRKNINPIDDTVIAVASLTADSGVSERGRPISFIARCRSNVTEAYAIWFDYVGDDSRDVYSDWKYVTVRIGDAPAKRQRWSVSSDNEATFAPDWAGALLKQLSGEARMILQLTPYSSSPVTAIFDVSGAKAALAPIAETCNWEFD